LIVGRPVLAALVVALGARVGRAMDRHCAGPGVLLVLQPARHQELDATNCARAARARAITAGTLPKRFGHRDVRKPAANAPALAVTLPRRQGGATHHLRASARRALAWSVLGLTLGGSSLLYLLIQRGAATQVSSLMYLVPPCTALMGWLLFGELFTVGMAVGLVLAAAGVALVIGPARRASAG
jgi:threonine/homoserine efflux transporter RhtA